jgi:methyl-accepting chemotaxis protein
MTRGRVAILLLLAAIGAGACGGDDDSADQFRDGYNTAIERLNQVNTDIQESGEEVATQPGPQIAKEFNRIAETAAQTRSDLAELDPPERAQDEFDDLLAAIEDGVASLRGVANAARNENQQQFQDAVQALAESGEDISAAETELKDAVESD